MTTVPTIIFFSSDMHNEESLAIVVENHRIHHGLVFNFVVEICIVATRHCSKLLTTGFDQELVPH